MKNECPSCALEVEQESGECPYCGYEFPETKVSRVWMAWLFAFLMILPLLYIVKRLF